MIDVNFLVVKQDVIQYMEQLVKQLRRITCEASYLVGLYICYCLENGIVLAPTSNNFYSHVCLTISMY